MKQTTLYVAFSLALAGAWCAAPARGAEHPEHPTAKTTAAAASGGLLDGKTFAGDMGKTGETKGDADEFVFKDGKFLSTACKAYGFDKATYVATEKARAISFTVEVKNDKGESMSWKGAVRGERIKGTALHQTAEGKTEYWFKGELKAAGSDKKSEHPEHPTGGAGKKAEHPEHPK